MIRRSENTPKSNDDLLTAPLSYLRPALRFTDTLSEHLSYEMLKQSVHLLETVGPFLFSNTPTDDSSALSSSLSSSSCCLIGLDDPHPRYNAEEEQHHLGDSLSIEDILEEAMRKSQSPGLRKRKKSTHHSSAC